MARKKAARAAQEPDRHGIEPDEALREIDGMDDDRPGDITAGIQRMFEQVTGTGWGGIDTDGAGLLKQRQETQRRANQEAAIFRDTFATKAGRKCLKLMAEMTVDAPPYPVEAQLPMDVLTPLIIAHDAQCNFFRAILAAIDHADKNGT